MRSGSAHSTARFWLMAACVAVTVITLRLFMLGKVGGHPVMAVMIATISALIGWRIGAAGPGGPDLLETPATKARPKVELRQLMFSAYVNFWAMEAAIISLLHMLVALMLIAGGIALAIFGWGLSRPFWITCLVFGIWIALFGVEIAMVALPGLTPKPRQYEPGRARFATRADVRRRGILEE